MPRALNCLDAALSVGQLLTVLEMMFPINMDDKES